MACQATVSRLPPYSGAPYMPSQQCSYSSVVNSSLGPQPGVLLVAAHVAEVGSQRGQPVAVDLLPPDHGSVELPFGHPERSLDPHPPGQLVESRQPVEGGEPGRPTEASRRRTPGPDAGADRPGKAPSIRSM